MAKWFVGPIIEKLMGKLIDTCTEYLQDQFRSQTVMEELERLRENHPKIQAVVSTASPVQMIDPDSPLNKWIWQLRDALDEADDVLDDFEYLKHEEQLVRNTEETKKRPSSSSPFGIAQKLHRVGESALKIDPNLARLKEVVQKLDRVLAEVSTFLPLLESTKKLQQEQQLELCKTRETGSLPKNDLIGRDKEKKFVIQWLRKRPNEEHQSHGKATMYDNISLLSIVAHGGMGKTTLLQHIYDDKITKKFDPKMWVCVSNNFDVKKVLADMLGPLATTRSSLESLDTLQNNLKSKVLSKKFLLVLDDIWEEHEERDKIKWENVLAPLAHGGLGSRILITTRMNSAAWMIAKVIKKKNKPLILEGLKEDECLQLLNTHAFAEDVMNLNVDKRLRSITEKLVKKLSGSPLAAKVMGGVLNSSLDERYWTNVLNNALDYNEIFPILKLSYIYLPKYLQNCFAFCSIFPQDHVFNEDDLIQMWIAVGFIHPSNNQGEDVEDIGRMYFDILVKKSLIDKVERGYKMHDLLHELAQFVSKQECFRVMVGEELLSKIPKTVRHLSVETSKLEPLKKMGKFKNLRTLWINYDGEDNQNFVNVLTDIFEVTKGIRLLSINALRQIMIPETIGCLKHLRYVKLDFPDCTSLPRSVSNLYHLQFLIVQHNVFYDDFFSRDMNKLSNLRFLRTKYYNFPGIGKLKFLQEVDNFVIKNETGYKIEELEHMNDLRILGIKGLENVIDAQEACNAKLYDKRKLTDLSLEWEATSQNIADLDIYVRVLDNLQPHNNLKKLSMSNYMGVRSAIWMNNADLINNLEDINLSKCLEWQILPPFGQLPFLKSLRLGNMPKVKRLDNIFYGNDMCCGFPSLVELSIDNVPQLQELPDLPLSLRTLNLDSLDNLNCLPSYLPPLCTLHLENLDNLNYLPSCLPSLSSLINLSISKVPQLRELQGLPPSLRELWLDNLDNLNCLPPCLPSLSFLTDVTIVSVPQLRELPDLPPSLCTLHLQNLDNLNCLPSCLPSLSSLTWLIINGVPQLRELPDLPPSLCNLYLQNLDNLNYLPSCLPTLSPLTDVLINRVPQLRELPDLPPFLWRLNLENLDNLNCLPSCLPCLSSLTNLYIRSVPQLREVPDLPPSLCRLILDNLDNLNCLPSCLPTLSSLTWLTIRTVSQLQELPDLPPSLRELYLRNLDNLNYLPSCLPTLSSLTNLSISNVPQLRELPDLPPSLKYLEIRECDPEFMQRHKGFSRFFI